MKKVQLKLMIGTISKISSLTHDNFSLIKVNRLNPIDFLFLDCILMLGVVEGPFHNR